MLDYLGAILIGLIAACRRLQRRWPGRWASASQHRASLIITSAARMFSFIVLFARGGENIGQWRSLPWYMSARAFLEHSLPDDNHTSFPEKLGAHDRCRADHRRPARYGSRRRPVCLLGVQTRPIDLTRVVASPAAVGRVLIAR